MANESKRLKKINILVIITFCLGLAMAIQIKSISDRSAFISPETVRDLEAQINIEKNEITNLEDYLERKSLELANFIENPESENIIELINLQKLDYEKTLGKHQLVGPGITVYIRDSDADVKAGQNPNELIVHDQDVVRILNDLKVAGAEAISINGQRYISTSEIKCSGATITINGKTYGQPFIIKAIGDPVVLEAGIKSIDSYSYMLSNIYSIKIDAIISEETIIPKFIGNSKNIYLSTKEDN